MTILSAVMAQQFALANGFEPAEAVRFAVTGYALGQATNPAMAALISFQMANAQTPAAPASSGAPGPSGAPALPTPGQTGSGSQGPNTPPPVADVVFLPDYRGMSVGDAVDDLRQLGLVPSIIPMEDPSRDKNTVTRQLIQDTGTGDIISVAPGTPLRRGTTVYLSVNVADRLTDVPNVEGLPIDEAEAKLKAAGLASQRIAPKGEWTKNDETSLAGRVLDQDPEPGTGVPDGTTVLLEVFDNSDGQGGHTSAPQSTTGSRSAAGSAGAKKT